MVLKKVAREHRFAIGFFAFLLAYAWIVVGKCARWQVDQVAFAFHAVDYGMGFCTKFLPGAIFRFLFPDGTRAQASAYETALMILVFALLSVLLDKWMRGVDAAHRKTALLLCFLFLTGPSTFSVYISELGMPDVYWIVFAALFFVCLLHKALYILIVPLCALSVLVHFSSVLTFLPFFGVIMLYKISCAEKKSEAWMLAGALTLSVAAAGGLILYFMAHEKENLVYSMEEFDRILKSRGVTVTSYFDYVLYDGGSTVSLLKYNGVYPEMMTGETPVGRLAAAVVNQLRWNKALLTDMNPIPGRVSLIALLLPVLAMLLGFPVHMLRIKTNRPLKRFAFFCMPALALLTFFAGMLFSTDYNRWMAHTLIPLFASALYVLYRERDAAFAYFEGLFAHVSDAQTTVYLAVYAMTAINPYDWI